MKLPLAILGVVVAILAVATFGALFTVDQRQQAIVLQFGEPRRVIQEPGLHVKVPFVQNVVYFDKRVLDLDPPTEQVILADQKRVNVDSFARYRIVDPLRFFQSVTNEARLRDRFGASLNSSVRNIAGLQSMDDLLSPKRDDIMRSIRDQVSATAEASFGIKIVDVRIGRADLPDDISNNVYQRMRSDREREANLLRAEGEEIKQTITAEADRQVITLRAEATQKASVMRGEGEAEQTRILANAHNRDPAFFSYIRSLQAYRAALSADDTTLVLSPDSEFFRYFASPSGQP